MNYLVLSPGRSGSIFLYMYLGYNLKKNVSPDYNFYHLYKTEDLREGPSVCHVHDIAIVNQILAKRDDFKVILIRRHPAEVAASFSVVKETGTTHFKRDETDNYNPVTIEKYIERFENATFTVDKVTCLRMTQHFIDWYIKAENLLSHAIILNYQQAIDIAQVNKKLGLNPINCNGISLPLAQPFDKWTKIQDGIEIRKAAYKLLEEYQTIHPHIFPKEDFNIEFKI
jgi:hypothetical protein